MVMGEGARGLVDAKEGDAEHEGNGRRKDWEACMA